MTCKKWPKVHAHTTEWRRNQLENSFVIFFSIACTSMMMRPIRFSFFNHWPFLPPLILPSKGLSLACCLINGQGICEICEIMWIMWNLLMLWSSIWTCFLLPAFLLLIKTPFWNKNQTKITVCGLTFIGQRFACAYSTNESCGKGCWKRVLGKYHIFHWGIKEFFF